MGPSFFTFRIRFRHRMLDTYAGTDPLFMPKTDDWPVGIRCRFLVVNRTFRSASFSVTAARMFDRSRVGGASNYRTGILISCPTLRSLGLMPGLAASIAATPALALPAP